MDVENNEHVQVTRVPDLPAKKKEKKKSGYKRIRTSMYLREG